MIMEISDSKKDMVINFCYLIIIFAISLLQKDMALNLNKFESPLSNYALFQVWFELAHQWF